MGKKSLTKQIPPNLVGIGNLCIAKIVLSFLSEVLIKRGLISNQLHESRSINR